jgi:hypothetical protein
MLSHHGRRVAGLATATATAALAAAAALATGPAQAAGATPVPQVLGINAAGNQFTLSTSTLRAGLDQITMHNTDPSRYESAAVGELKNGVTQSQFLTALHSSNPASAYGLLTFDGGDNSTAAGQATTSLAVLSPGQYVVVNFLPGPDGVPQVLEGMLAWFTVTGPAAPWRPPAVNGVFSVSDKGYIAPPVVSPHGIYQFINTAAANAHELGLVRLLPGKTLADFEAWVAAGQNPATMPGTLSGGVTAISPGALTWAVTNLTSGTYVAADWVTDPATGKKFVAEGNVAQFQVP